MPAAEAVLSWATEVANQWRSIAIAWHVALAVLLVLLIRSRISQRLLGVLLALPIASVAAIATISRNPFNAAMFAVLTLLLAVSAVSLPSNPPVARTRAWRFAGVVLIVFGWSYPHFVVTDGWVAYTYASPFGLLPCPTLSVVIGVALATGLDKGAWAGAVAAAGVLYGAIGVFRLGVAIDMWLLMGALLLGSAIGYEALRPYLRNRSSTSPAPLSR